MNGVIITPDTASTGAPAPSPWLPVETPVSMPVQTLRKGKLSNRQLPTTPGAMAWRRALVIGGAGLLTLVAAYQIWWVLRGSGTDVLEGLLLVLFVALFAWIAQAFVSALAGLLIIASHPLRMMLGGTHAWLSFATWLTHWVT